MSIHPSARIHPTAIVSPQAEIGPDVRVEAFAIVEGQVTIGQGCILRPRSHLIGPLTLGVNNQVYSNAVLGERPQHFQYRDEPTGVAIGDNNVFRENVTIHRGTTQSMITRVGSGNYLMAGSHIGHDCQVGNNCIFANGAVLGGHCVLGNNVYLSAYSGVHQFCRLGRLCFLGGLSSTTKDIPPFIMQQHRNCVVGVNVVGMRRAGMTARQINAIRRVFRITYMQDLSLPNAMARAERELGDVDAVQEYLQFVRESKRGINGRREEEEGPELAAA
jgi:UDP-N-acetylglucosamine acyltransferase